MTHCFKLFFYCDMENLFSNILTVMFYSSYNLFLFSKKYRCKKKFLVKGDCAVQDFLLTFMADFAVS